ncbi:TIGR00730 family Rossman fold protein [Urechidicola vernalis]|uniref:Cytokinin riboside 5'-monophosphate phosphoribohydrolase n=1 Tax=Urechidicola vernalis TaxID=3075600 RepID=A0ABU2Y3Q2_9FLAO|nr:TIGR00730 family Rossman fold protein [Urechidicola sp. P050]MDT0552833.1 TIGR00730 family Rossman fold protein [Urechidicola sp. P050]
MKKIAVFCGASIGFNPIYKDEAQRVGAFFGKNNIGLVYGGGKIGMMGALADELLKHKGEVIGIIPHLLKNEEVVHSELSQLIETKTMSTRKVKISKLVDGYIALAGGFGTLDEIFEALTLGQLGIESKPIGLLNTQGFFSPMLAQLDLMVEEGFLKKANRDMVLVSDNIEELIELMYQYKAPKMTKIVNTVVKK